MRVLEATDFFYPWIAGPAPFIASLSEGLSRRGHDVAIACPSPDGRAYDEDGSVTLHRVRTVPVPFGYRLRSGAPFGDLSRYVRAYRPDVVHIHHPFPISIAAALTARVHGVPIVATNHTIPQCTLFGLRGSKFYGPARRALGLHIRSVLGLASVVTTPTATAAAMLRDLGFRREVRAISNGVDTERFTPALERAEGSIPIVLYTGRLDDDKEVGALIDAIPHVLSRLDVRFRIGGEGTDRTRLERLVTERGLGSHVCFTGYVPNDDLPAVYQAASVYVMPSPVELQSISTLEAMASGLPIVAAKTGALPELVRSGGNGFLVPPADGPAFADAIVKILTDSRLGAVMGEESRRIAQEHSLGEMVTCYETIFRELAIDHDSRRVGAAGF